MVIDLDNEYLSSRHDNDDTLDRRYTIDDCMIVRKTDAFPFNGIVTTPRHGKATVNGVSDLTWNQIKVFIDKFIIENYGDVQNTDFNKYMTIYDTVKSNFSLVYSSPRDTIHVCINGTVSNHAYGTFDREFAVLDEFSKHVDDSLVCVRGEDTYFNNDITISKIVMSKDKYNSIKDDPNYKDTLDKLQVFIFDSNTTSLDDACSKTLHYLGFDSLGMSSSYIQGHNVYTDDEDLLLRQNKATIMSNFLRDFAIENNLSTTSHFNSNDHYNETEESSRLGKKNDINNLFYIISKMSNLSDEEKDKIKEEIYKCGVFGYLDFRKDKVDQFNEILGRVFSHTSFEELVRLTRSYNAEYLDALNNNKEMKLYYDEKRFKSNLDEMFDDDEDEFIDEDDYIRRGNK